MLSGSDFEARKFSRNAIEKLSDYVIDKYQKNRFGLEKHPDKGNSSLRESSCIYISQNGERRRYDTQSLPEKQDGNVRFVFISDIHSTMNSLDETNVPYGDVLIIAGDIAMTSMLFSDGYCYKLYSYFNRWLARQPHTRKFVIAGNHDGFLEKLSNQEVKELLSAATYLEDSGATVNGLRIWGSPVSWGNSPNKAFQNRHAERLAKIEPCDVLITHDCVEGIPELREKVLEIAPRIHVSGHVHYNYGSKLKDGILSVNASARPERILFVICDIDGALNSHNKVDTLINLIGVFIEQKNRLDFEHEFGLCVLRDDVTFLCDLTSDMETINQGLNNLKETLAGMKMDATACMNMGKFFAFIKRILEEKSVLICSKNLVPLDKTFRVIFVYVKPLSSRDINPVDHVLQDETLQHHGVFCDIVTFDSETSTNVLKDFLMLLAHPAQTKRS